MNAAIDIRATESATEKNNRPFFPLYATHRNAAIRALAFRIVVEFPLDRTACPRDISIWANPAVEINCHAVCAYDRRLVVEKETIAVHRLKRNWIDRAAVEVEHRRGIRLARQRGIVASMNLVHNQRSAFVEIEVERIAACVYWADVSGRGIKRPAVVDCDRSARRGAVDVLLGDKRSTVVYRYVAINGIVVRIEVRDT